MTNIESSSPPPPSASLSPQDIERLLGRFSELEADVDAFSTALLRLSGVRGHRVSSSSSSSTGGGIVHDRVGGTDVINQRELSASASRGPSLTVLLYPVLAFVLVGAATALVSRRNARVQKVGRDRDLL